jgi:hypothetical protein
MTLGARLEELRRTRRIIRPPRQLSPLRIEESYDRVLKRFDHLGSTRVVDYDALLAKLRLAPTAKSVISLTLRDMRLAASCLFDGEQPLVENESFLDQYLDALRSIRSRMAIKRLIHSYCLHFNPNHRGIRRIGSFLREAVSSVEGRWEWPERHRQYRLFDPAQAPHELAKLTVDSSDPRKQLENVGLSGQLSTGGLSVHVFLSALTTIRKSLESSPRIEEVDRAIAWMSSEDDRDHFSAYRCNLANALLLPFADREPDQDVRRRIQSHLLDSLSDPRIDRGPWVRADDAARAVMIRWLAQATLEQFLKVVDRVAPRHQWEYRRAFWGAYINKGVVGNAWVAFSSDGAHVARQITDSTDDKLMRRFATLAGATQSQAVLIVSIGDLVVADWSHDGKLRIWRRDKKSAPELSMPSYLAPDLRAGSDFETVHRPPDGWQRKAEAYIRRHTGIGLTEREYMPSGKRR